MEMTMNISATSAPNLGDCIGLVRSIAWALAPGLPDHIHTDDLLGEGFLGLIEALDRFNPERQVLFTTFAYPRVRGRMLDFVKKECRAGTHRTCRLQEWLPAPSPSPEHEAAVREEVEHVLERVEQLPWRRRELIRGIAREEELKEVADRLALSMPNAHKLTRLAREALRAPRPRPLVDGRVHRNRLPDSRLSPPPRRGAFVNLEGVGSRPIFL